MKLSHPIRTLLSAVLASALSLFLLEGASAAPVVGKPNADAPVKITDNGDTWTMDNGIVRAVVDKRGGIPSLVYHGTEIIGDPKRPGRWAQGPTGRITPSVTIDPAKNGGARGEVEVKGIGSPLDTTLRYTLERGVSGFYATAQYSHPAQYPEFGFGESRFLLQMNPIFNWLSVDADRNMKMTEDSSGVVIHAKEQTIMNRGIYKGSVEHKYSYSGVLAKLPAFGWSSTKEHIGAYMINPSAEYIGGGATRLDLGAHLGATLITYWNSGHYGGGTTAVIRAGEKWSKVVGPIFIYFNALDNPETPSQVRSGHFGRDRGQSHHSACLDTQRQRAVSRCA